MSESIHTIWCPPGWSPEQTWEHICRGGIVPTLVPLEEGRWHTLLIENATTDAAGERLTGGRLMKVLTA